MITGWCHRCASKKPPVSSLYSDLLYPANSSWRRDEESWHSLKPWAGIMRSFSLQSPTSPSPLSTADPCFRSQSVNSTCLDFRNLPSSWKFPAACQLLHLLLALRARDHMGIFWNKPQDGSLIFEEGTKEVKKMTICLLKRKLRHTSKPNSSKNSSSQEQKHRAPWLMERILWASRVHQICNVMWLKLESTLFQLSSSYALRKKWLLSFQLQASLSPFFPPN